MFMILLALTGGGFTATAQLNAVKDSRFVEEQLPGGGVKYTIRTKNCGGLVVNNIKPDSLNFEWYFKSKDSVVHTTLIAEKDTIFNDNDVHGGIGYQIESRGIAIYQGKHAIYLANINKNGHFTVSALNK